MTPAYAADPELVGLTWCIVNNWPEHGLEGYDWLPLSACWLAEYSTIDRLVLWISLGYQP